ncbi:BCCT family transporter [Egibacter rhizosphaerae]|nr:BCCT family transporter [Egibacter rhizosphaerae]
MVLNPWVASVSATVIAAFVVLGATAPELLGTLFDRAQAGIAASLGWYYILVVGGLLVLLVWLGASRFGRIRLGPPDSRPDYGYPTWFAMLFTAGMGIGLVFWSVAEPLSHLTDPPQAEAGTVAARQEAMQFTFFHWGLHAWGVYAVVGLALAYFAYRHELPLSMRSALYPLLGDRIHGGVGNTVDVFAVFGTMFGVATSLGFGILQVNAGLSSLGLLPQNQAVQLLILVAVTAGAVTSLLLGIDKGILRLSITNLCVAVTLLVFVLFAGPTEFVLSSFVEQVGRYVQTLPETTFWTDAGGDGRWQAEWTIFYWGWWLSWSPFVGLFIARVSRGRTIREFAFGVLLVPAGLTFLWMAVFGNTAFTMDEATGGELSAAVAEDPAIALFELLGALPLTEIMTVLAILLVAIYFVTSSDSASLVIDQLTSGGSTETPRFQRAFWAIGEGAVAGALLLAGAGGLEALQTAAITTALPFSVVLLLTCWGLVRALYADDLGTPIERVVLSQPDHERVPPGSAGRSPFKDGISGSP